MRLIDADALPKYTGYALSADEVAMAVENAPTIDAVPVRHGHWIKHEGRNGAKDSIECSYCGVWIDDMPRKTFCPNCGSIMYRYGKEDE